MHTHRSMNKSFLRGCKLDQSKVSEIELRCCVVVYCKFVQINLRMTYLQSNKVVSTDKRKEKRTSFII